MAAGGQTLRRSLFRIAAPGAMALFAALVGLGITQLPPWRQLELKIFDALVVHTAPNTVTLPITIIGIEDATLAELNEAWPLSRKHHARLLDNLAEAGAAVVAFDVPFPDPSGNKEDDDAFAASINRFGRVVLAAEHAFRETASIRQWTRVDPYDLLLLAGARVGYSSLEVDADAVLRQVPQVNDAFWRAVVNEFDRVQPNVAEITEARPEMRIRYLGAAHTFTYIPYQQMLDPEKKLAGWKDFFRDNIVLVGRNLHVIGEVGAAQGEVYQTPFFQKTREFTPRVEVHANLVATMIAGSVLREAPPEWVFGAWIAAALAGFAFMRRWHPLRSGIALVVLVSLLGGVEYLLFVRWQTWLPVVGAGMTATLMYAAEGAVAFIAEQRQRQEIRGAFSMYVSPAVVDQVIAHPERLKLGGERRELTILFSDLAGFTSISEGMMPEQVAGLINRHLSDMTQVVMEHFGTVDKFLGDGVMAFWGAPISDEKQSERALAAAIEMQKRTEKLALEVAASTGVRLSVRIGINRGPCVVGNMGGDTRFDYTAMGDAVNLSSRLEGVNKVYGTTILVSESVANAVRGLIDLREVDTVRVKGKQQGITVFAPCADLRLRDLSAAAIAAYQTGDFEAAEAAWRRVSQEFPADPVAKVFIERVAALRDSGPIEGWDGVFTLDSK